MIYWLTAPDISLRSKHLHISYLGTHFHIVYNINGICSTCKICIIMYYNLMRLIKYLKAFKINVYYQIIFNDFIIKIRNVRILYF